MLVFGNVTTPQPPPEALLIAEMRKKPPYQSVRQAARAARMSETRWRQIESGRRQDYGHAWPVRGPAPIVAKMARVVSVTPEQLTAAERPDAAGELEALLIAAGPFFTQRQNDALHREMNGSDDDDGRRPRSRLGIHGR